MGGKTSTTSKQKYNDKTYRRYEIKIRKDDELNQQIEEYLKEEFTTVPVSFNSFILSLNRLFFIFFIYIIFLKDNFH